MTWMYAVLDAQSGWSSYGKWFNPECNNTISLRDTVLWMYTPQNPKLKYRLQSNKQWTYNYSDLQYTNLKGEEALKL